MKSIIPAIIIILLEVLSPAAFSAGGKNPAIFSDPLRYQRMPWLAAAEAGNRLWEAGDEEGAIREWEKAVSEGLTDGNAFFNLGRHYFLREDWKKTIYYLRQAQPRLEPAGAQEGMILAVYEMLALAYLHQRDYSEAHLHYLRGLRLAPDSPALHLGLARLYLIQGKLNSAEKSAGRALELLPDNGEACRIMALAAEKRGDFPAAAEYYRRSLAEDPEDWRVRLARGLILAVNLNREKEAERELEIVVRENPNQDQAHAVLGEIYLRRGDQAAAAAAAGRALAANPENYSALNLQGRLRLAEGEFAAAEPYFRAALGVEAEGALALYGLGVILFQRREYRTAEAYLRRALVRAPEFPEAALNRGLALEAMGNREEAFRVLSELAARRPDFAPGHLGLGQLYLYSGQAEQALPFFRNALALDPAAWEPYYLIGKCLRDRGDPKAAREYFISARQRGGTAPALLTDLALAHEETGELDRAEAVLEEVLAADRNYLPALLRLSSLRGRRGKTPEAETLYRQAMIIRPGDTRWGNSFEERDFLSRLISGIEEYLGGGLDYLNLLALIRNFSRDREIFADLVPVLQEKVLAQPREPHFAHLLGMAYEEKRDLENAERYFQRALLIDSDFAAAHLSLGWLYTRMGRTREARKHLSAVLLLAPGSAFTPDVRGLLQDLPE